MRLQEGLQARDQPGGPEGRQGAEVHHTALVDGRLGLQDDRAESVEDPRQLRAERARHARRAQVGAIVLAAVTGAALFAPPGLGRTTTLRIRGAVERMEDGIGDDDLLCESDEACIVLQNIGPYQGHGALTESGTIGRGGAIENVTLYTWSTNGY